MTDAFPMVAQADSPETRRYNRIHRWLEIADFLIGLAFLVVLLATGWTSTLRDWAYRSSGQHYMLAVFFYITMLLAISKVLGFALDYYGFRLEHRYNLSNQRIRSWLWDQAKTWLITLIIGSVLVELIYWTIRTSPQHWWMIAWVVFILLSIFFAQQRGPLFTFDFSFWIQRHHIDPRPAAMNFEILHLKFHRAARAGRVFGMQRLHNPVPFRAP